MSDTVKTLEHLDDEIENTKFDEKEKKILREIIEITGYINDSADTLDYPTDQLIDLLDDFGGTDNPLFMLVAFIYKHIEDIYPDEMFGDFFDFDE